MVLCRARRGNTRLGWSANRLLDLAQHVDVFDAVGFGPDKKRVLPGFYFYVA